MKLPAQPDWGLNCSSWMLAGIWALGAKPTSTLGLEPGQVDPVKSPNGLAPVRAYAHSLGLKFGLWVEPERVHAPTIGKPGLVREEWLAKNNDSYLSDATPQVCLASSDARQWVFDRLATLIDEIQPDYLKWDNNFWVNCNRAGHGHETSDGNYAHVSGLYGTRRPRCAPGIRRC